MDDRQRFRVMIDEATDREALVALGRLRALTAAGLARWRREGLLSTIVDMAVREFRDPRELG